uniref:RNase H type-1 domain-containing protein n=1 Tax=Oryza punctata TaxID=4537 RepID=A0A0E0JQ38_ORYPU
MSVHHRFLYPEPLASSILPFFFPLGSCLDGYAKVNVNAAFIEDTGEASAGIIVRDCRGLVEALACLEGLRVAMEWIHMPLAAGSYNNTCQTCPITVL